MAAGLIVAAFSNRGGCAGIRSGDPMGKDAGPHGAGHQGLQQTGFVTIRPSGSGKRAVGSFLDDTEMGGAGQGGMTASGRLPTRAAMRTNRLRQ
jgi:hypothetical protein